MDTIRLTIDGQAVTAVPGSSVLDAALAHGIYVPHLCHHPDLKPVGACRLCGVEIGGRTVMSCVTPVAAGLDVRTSTPALDAARRTVMDLLLAKHHQDCLHCSAGVDCELLRIAGHIGLRGSRLGPPLQPAPRLPIDDSNPFFTFDPNKCILCGICVRTCQEIVGLGALGLSNRGYETRVSLFGDGTFAGSVCESCGECVSRCPVGALAPKRSERPSHEIQTTCVYCGVGCGIYLGVKGNRIVSVRGDHERPTNEGSLCVKGRYGFNFINHPDRLRAPLIKRNGQFVEASWDEALDLVAQKFATRKAAKFAALASAKCTNEDNYVIQKLTRAVMQTNTVDHCARL